MRSPFLETFWAEYENKYFSFDRDSAKHLEFKWRLIFDYR